MSTDPNLVISSHNGRLTRDGVTFEVSIVRLEHETEWSLEVVNADGTSTVWDETFPTDDAAFAELEATIAEEGMETILDNATVIPFPR